MRNRCTKYGRGCRGMTLVELLLVMAILAIVMLAVMGLYVPAQQSTVAQNQVSDIQSNLRLALKVMTRDILIAGFLVADDPIIAAGPTGFTIRTRIVGNSFARISGTSDDPPNIELTVTDPEMTDNFRIGSRVRLFEPINSAEVMEQPLGSVTDADRAYPVADIVGSTIVINKSNNPNLVASHILPESLILLVSDANQPPMQTIQYLITDDSLQRIVNGNMQVLARDMDMANSEFVCTPTPEGRIIKVDIKLTGKTVALKDDAVSGEKSRSVETTVKLRNVF